MLTLFFIILLTILILFFFKDLHFIKQFALSAAGFVMIVVVLIVFMCEAQQDLLEYIFTVPFKNDYVQIVLWVGLTDRSVYFLIVSVIIFLCILFIWEKPFFKENVIQLFTWELLFLVVFSFRFTVYYNV